jgi:transposase
VDDLAYLSRDELAARLAEALSDAEAERRKREELQARFEKLDSAYRSVQEQLALLQRRIFVARAERVDTTQLELEFSALAYKLNALSQARGDDAPGVDEGRDDAGRGPKGGPKGSKPKGRRPVVDENHPADLRIRIEDPLFAGVAREVGVETSYRIGYQRPKLLRIAVDRVKYEVVAPGENPSIRISPVPRECHRRGLLAPSMIAHVLLQKFGCAIPFHRQSKMLAANGIDLDDATMGRYAENVGATLGPIVDAMAKAARSAAFCLATDATGVCIQPAPEERKGTRRACSRGHFFVVLADRDHVFFEYTRQHRTDVVCEMFRGFSGYIQADANAVYDAVFRGSAVAGGEDAPKEVACWSHARRGFWECAVTSKEADARAMLLQIARIFDEDAKWKDLAPDDRRKARDRVLRPMLDHLFAWAKEREPIHEPTRSRLARAFGYLRRHEVALRRFLDDGRLVLTNNRSESALRDIAIGRKNWMFFGSDDHAGSAATLFSLVASCRLHGLDAEHYLAEVIHVFPQWPRERYLELAPKHWAATRERLLAANERTADVLSAGIGFLEIPEPPAAPSEEQSASG